MTTRQIICHVARCNVCGAAPEPDYHWDDPQVAVDYTAEHDDWTLAGDQLVCGASDTAHYLARGGESPDLLQLTADAMSVNYAKEVA